MRIALIGYGKMGRMIEETAIQRGHQVALKIDKDNEADFTKENLAAADVAIEFTAPDSAYANVKTCLDFGVPVVSGSTGWNQHLDDVKQQCLQRGGAFLHASNFSIGVNIFFEINKRLAQLMAAQPEYDVTIHEIHHTQKLDKPSGTAVTLAEGILQNHPRKTAWALENVAASDQLVITCERVDPAPGTHQVRYTSAVDDIEIMHTAHNRKGFALGAVLAAEFIHNKKGVFTMKDVLGF
jgi:4-hydroxy-tetrahydrodipicolinate reductase